MINNYSSKVEEVALEPSTARSLAKKLKSIGYVNQYRNSEKKNREQGNRDVLDSMPLSSSRRYSE